MVFNSNKAKSKTRTLVMKTTTLNLQNRCLSNLARQNQKKNIYLIDF